MIKNITITALLIIAWLAAGMGTAAPPTFEAQKVEEASVVGSLVELTPKHVVLDTSDGKVELELSKLLFLKPKDVESKLPPPASVWVELVDGSTLAAVQYLVEADKAKIMLVGGETVSAPVKAIKHVRLQPETPKSAAEWLRILGLKAEGDVLVTRSGESIDYHQGVLRDVLEESVKFELDGDALPIKRTKIYGFAYRHAAAEKMTPTVGFFLDSNGSRWAAADFSLGNKLSWTTPGGVKFECPLSDVKTFDFSLGKVQYLGDLAPESVAWTPFFGQGQVSPTLEKFHAPRIDVNFDSQPLQIKKKTYSKGVALRSRTEIVYRMPAASSRFKAVAGIDDSVASKGRVRLVIRGDEKVLFDASVIGTEPPHELDLDISGVRRLTILVDFGDTFGAGDHLILGNARIYQ